jgi:hypothetical protein
MVAAKEHRHCIAGPPFTDISMASKFVQPLICLNAAV